MFKSLAGVALVVAAATALLAAPANASTAGTSADASVAATAARPQLIRTKVYFGRCKDTCQVKVRVTNISRKTLYRVKLNANLTINGRKMGACYDNVGTIKARKVRWASCTVRTATLSRYYNAWLDGDLASYNKYARTSVSYLYYR
ncbi:hypothetical protein ABGB18_34540 [Nonomuraea sp. B12E4]|uniref:hypothetical protein n=1 Tax=Nonomuraea sp. B12E4 TaxID=3153564 RepID=UPI00325EA8E7